MTPTNPIKNEKKKQTRLSSKKSSEASKRVHNLIIIDESGSMMAIYQPAISGLNQTLQTIKDAQKENPKQKHYVSLVAFSTEHYNQIYDDIPVEKSDEVNAELYRPNGCTPLLDAMGRSINELRQKVGKDDIVLVSVITDGYENASKEYTIDSIKKLIEQLKKEDWIFTYIGANQNVDIVASALSIDNRLLFDASSDGTFTMFETEKRSRRKFFANIENNVPVSALASNYFVPDDDPLPF